MLVQGLYDSHCERHNEMEKLHYIDLTIQLPDKKLKEIPKKIKLKGERSRQKELD